MGKTVENPKRHIVSCRLTDDEFEALASIARRDRLSLSDALREQMLTGVMETARMHYGSMAGGGNRE